MKKLFVCAMALAAFVSCSKDDVAQGVALDSKNKSIEITIANGNGSTRADLTGGLTAPGVADEGKTNTMASADAEDLVVLFANGDNILHRLSLAAGGTSDDDHTGIADPSVPAGMYVADKTNGSSNTYIWHNVPWQVTHIAIVRTADDDAELNTISAYKALALNESANIGRNLDEIVLFGTDDLEDMNVTHEVDGISYHYWKAVVEVKPWLARFEVNRIMCDDLGYLNIDTNTDGTPNTRTYGFDELLAKSLVWTSKAVEATEDAPALTANNYSAKYEDGKTVLGTMYGVYNPTVTDNAVQDPAKRLNYIKPANANVWSWNVADRTTFNDMTVDLEALAYDYTLDEDGKKVPLLVTGLNSAETAFVFEAGNIYQLDLTFVEGNVKDQDALCVQVEVKIADWTINTVQPVFGQNGSSTKPQQ